MAVIIETSIGDLTIDLYTEERPNCSKNFLKLCKIKYYNFSLFHCVQRNFIAQTGDPTGTGRGGESVYYSIYGEQARYFDMEKNPIIKHRRMGSISMVNNGSDMHGSQFFVTLGENLDSLDGRHTVFGFVSEGLDTLGKLSEVYCDREGRPYQDVRILHTVVLDDPFEDPRGLTIPDRSPSPTKEMLESGRLRIDEEIDGMKDKPKEEVDELIAQKEARARATILEMIGDIPDSEVKPPDNVLFVCKLNPVTSDEDLEVIFSRFGSILCCEVIRDQKTGDSLCYAFIEFENREDCETAYFKMDNVLIDDRRIHVDFSQSVSKVRWMGKGTGTGHFADGRDFRDKKKNAVDIYEDEPDELPWKLKEQKRGGKQYDLVFSDEEGDGKKSPSSRKRKQRPQSRSRSPDRREQPREQPSEGKRERRSRSRERERRERDSRENRDRENRDNRDRERENRGKERERDRDREREKEKERERNRESDKFRDRRERDRRRSPERHQRSHRD